MKFGHWQAAISSPAWSYSVASIDCSLLGFDNEIPSNKPFPSCFLPLLKTNPGASHVELSMIWKTMNVQEKLNSI